MGKKRAAGGARRATGGAKKLAGKVKRPAAAASQLTTKPTWMMRPTPAGARVTERVRKLCLALPEVTERLSHGEATWFVQGKRVVASMSDQHHDDRVAFVCPAPAGAQEVMVATQPHKFFRPPYVGGAGWLGVYLDVPEVDWGEIADLLVDAYRQVAPPKLLDRLADR